MTRSWCALQYRSDICCAGEWLNASGEYGSAKFAAKEMERRKRDNLRAGLAWEYRICLYTLTVEVCDV